MSRAAFAPIDAIALVVVAFVLGGCGADAHLQHQAAASRTVTCQSIIERQDETAAPHIDPEKWLAEVSRAPKRLTETINEREIIDDCFDVGAQLDSDRSERSDRLRYPFRSPTSDRPRSPDVGPLRSQLSGSPASSSIPLSSLPPALRSFLQRLRTTRP